MKKLFLLFTLFGALAFTSCELIHDDDPHYDETLYSGTLTVIPLSGGGSYTWDNSRVSLLEERDGTFTLWLLDTRFVPQMPPMTMAVPGISYAVTPTLVSLLGDNIVPYVGGTPYRQYLITTLAGTITGNQLNLSFTCMNCRVTYIGYEYYN